METESGPEPLAQRIIGTESLWQIARALPNNLKRKYGWQKSALVGGKPRNKKQKTLNKIYCDYVNLDGS